MIDILILIISSCCLILLIIDSISTFLEKISTIKRIIIKISISTTLSLLTLPYNIGLSIGFMIPIVLYFAELVEMIKH